jgi:predicted O-linked N-acetylglucosamine transferase (SPINDLY family)
LLLKTQYLGEEAVRAALLARFAVEGVSEGRVEFRGRTPTYLAEYDEVDIALDPFPRTGGATTADALWMGVPVVTLAGQRMIERQGASMLTAVGLTEWIARSEAEYISKAVALAEDPNRRAAFRGSLRQRMTASPLCDGRGLAAALEQAYRDMWRRYLYGASA